MIMKGITTLIKWSIHFNSCSSCEYVEVRAILKMKCDILQIPKTSILNDSQMLIYSLHRQHLEENIFILCHLYKQCIIFMSFMQITLYEVNRNNIRAIFLIKFTCTVISPLQAKFEASASLSIDWIKLGISIRLSINPRSIIWDCLEQKSYILNCDGNVSIHGLALVLVCAEQTDHDLGASEKCGDHDVLLT